MIHRTPSGTRDVLPTEMGEIRRMTERILGVFDRAGYGELYTPALEYESTFGRAEMSAARPAYRFFDEQGEVLVLRPDMTVPIARLVGTRFADRTDPLRFCYFAHAYRGAPAGRGHSREFLQAGVELIGAPAPAGTAEALTVLCAALEAAGLQDYRVGLGDVSLYPALLRSFGVPAPASEAILAALARGDFVWLEHLLHEVELPAERRELLLRVPRIRGGADVLSGLTGPLQDAIAGMHEVLAALPANVAQRVIFDFGLVRSIGYYTGAVFQVYDPAYGEPLGSGGRYDELLGLFGRPQPAVGFALNVERLHIALAGEERGELTEWGR